jgi:peptidoglycan-N-acetylglucosamine deacetylase
MLVAGLAGAGMLALGAGAWLGPHVSRPFAVRRLGDRCRTTRSVVLTFDDGPGAESTPRLLNLLAEFGVRATFFLLGMRGAQHPELVADIRARGHEIGWHTHGHRNAWSTWPWTAVSDVRQGFATLPPHNGETRLFRPPCGKLTLWTWAAARQYQARIAWWTIDSGDTWTTLPAPQDCCNAVQRAGGGVVLLHDFDRAAARHAFVLDATRRILTAARADGLSVRPFSELL